VPLQFKEAWGWEEEEEASPKTPAGIESVMPARTSCLLCEDRLQALYS
jgi:hypothetical protein